MKAVLLSAGQGRRLLPLTRRTPKCALSVGGKPLVVWQIEQLLAQGMERVTVVVGFESGQVERILADRFPAGLVQTIYNPFHQETDNLVSCWVVGHEMTEDFLLLNGDTLFESRILARLLWASDYPLTLAMDRKAHYDADDMKLRTRGQTLLAVGKGISPQKANGESMGLMAFRDQAPAQFREALQRAVRREGSRSQWYLTAVNELAGAGVAGVCPMDGCRWTEVDTRPDLEQADQLVREGALTAWPIAGTSAR